MKWCAGRRNARTMSISLKRWPMRQSGGSVVEGTAIMRIVLIGVSHWHTPFYSEPVLAMTDAAIVGVSDPDAARAEPLAAKAKCPVFADYRDMCATLKPDFA